MPNSSLTSVVVLAMMGMSGVAAASEYRCERGDETVRRVEIAVEDPATGVPCEVVYWKDHEEPGVRRVLWNAQTDSAFCQRKAKELVTTLEEGGWACAAPGPSDQPPADQATAAGPPAPASVGRAPSALAASEAPAQRQAGGRQASKPQTQATEPQAKQSQTSDEKPAIRAALAPQHAQEGAAETTPPPKTAEPSPDGSAETAALPERTALNAIIEQNLVRLNDGVEGQFAAKVGRYGDLDGDGLDDGLVFFTYQSDRLGEARFIAAYLYDGENYTLAATKPVAGSDERVQSAEVEAIERGVISLRLHIREPGDAACCPSGTRHQTLVLQGGQLVEVRNSASPRSESPS